jgi:hypothetical protein
MMPPCPAGAVRHPENREASSLFSRGVSHNRQPQAGGADVPSRLSNSLAQAERGTMSDVSQACGEPGSVSGAQARVQDDVACIGCNPTTMLLEDVA